MRPSRCCVFGVVARCASLRSLISPTSSRRSSATWGCGHIPLMPRQTARWPSRFLPRLLQPGCSTHSPRKDKLWQELALSGTRLPKSRRRSGLSHASTRSILTGAGERAKERLPLGHADHAGAASPKENGYPFNRC